MSDHPSIVRRRWWRRRRAWCVLLLVSLILFHGPLLRSVHGLLTHQDKLVRADAVVIVDGDFRHERAAELIQKRMADKILLVAARPRRTVSHGILPARDKIDLDRLVKLGVDETRIAVIGAAAERMEWRSARALQTWLPTSPDARAIVICSRHDSRRTRYIFNRILGPEQAHRVFVLGIPSGRYDEASWWYSRDGWKSVFGAYLALLYAWFRGEDEIAPLDWDLDQFEKQLRE